MRRAKAAIRRASVVRSNEPLDAEVASTIDHWVGRSLSPEQAAFCRRAVRAISPPTASAAGVYLTPLASLVRWCAAEYVPLDEAHVFSPATYERWFRSLSGFSGNTTDSYRGRVRAMAFVLAPTSSRPPRRRPGGPRPPRPLTASSRSPGGWPAPGPRRPSTRARGSPASSA